MSVIVEWSFVISTLLMIGFKYWRILFILCFEHNYACAYMNTNSHLHMLIYLKLAYQSLNYHISLLTCVRYEIFLLLYIISSVIMVLNLNLITLNQHFVINLWLHLYSYTKSEYYNRNNYSVIKTNGFLH